MPAAGGSTRSARCSCRKSPSRWARAPRALFGRATPVGASRGRPHLLPDGSEAWITVHPSYLLRVPDAARAEAYADFVADLGLIAARLR